MMEKELSAAGESLASVGPKQADPFSVFFLQRLHEALFDYAADSFKAPALNTHLRVVELRRIGLQAQEHEFLSASVESFFGELDWSVTADPVLKGVKKDLVRELIGRAKDGWGKSSTFVPAIQALESLFKGYYADLRQALLQEAAASPWSKERTLQLIDCLIVELELVGFPRSNIYSVTQKITQGKRQGRLGKGPVHTVELFLKHFGTVRRKFSAYMFVAPALAQELEHRKWLRISDEKGPELAGVRGWEDFAGEVDRARTPALMAFQTEVLCAQAASRAAFSLADRVVEQINFIDHHTPLAVHDKVFCVETSLRIATFCPRPSSPLRYAPKISSGQAAEVLDVFRWFFNEGPLGRAAIRRVTRAFEYHGAALAAKRPEDQLLNLWSCLEGFVGVPASAGSKISFVREVVLSTLTLLYPQRLFGLTWQRLVEVLGTEELGKHLIGPATVSREKFDQLALMLLCPEYEQARSDLAAAVAPRDPVLLFRLFHLVKRFKDPATTRETLVKHRDKVAWQLNRIYWNRNLIVHSAESLPYLSILVEHLHVYIDSFLTSILAISAQEDMGAVPAILELISTHEKHRMHELANLRGTMERSSAAVLTWTFGEANVLRKLDGF